ncbi:MAG: hypothetical protein DMG25_19995 [Acidobacteria bacterium]|nr:MAG: hypothetical protein DMG25_19995 [Acidobacteriota bacterium]PYV21915.1 MAG: hypothetical protein DMG27_19500 [Acidobacteriota bacterium]
MLIIGCDLHSRYQVIAMPDTETGAELEGLSLGPWASQRRKELLELLDQLGPRTADLDQAVKTEAERRPEAVELMKHKGVGSVTAWAFVLTLGPVERFRHSRQVVSYLGLKRPRVRRGSIPNCAVSINA